VTTPTVAIVGRPNVGKSTLFNRLVGRRQAIVHDQPGVTRDRVFGIAALEDERAFQVVDTGGLVPGDDPIGLGGQVLLAVEESDLLIFLVDGVDGLTTADQRVWEALRGYGKPTVLVVNKGDVRRAREGFAEFYALGIDPLLVVSAEHGTGIPDLRAALAAMLPEAPPPPEIGDAVKVAIVGRPNVGKSSLVNKLSGQLRALVSPVAGTTRDPLDTMLEREGRHYLLIDTAGIRRRSQVTGAAEGLAVMLSRRQIERADVAVLLVDATAGVTSGDLAIAGTIWERGRAAVVAVNKWDLIDEEARERLDLGYPRLEQVLANPRRVNLSAVSGRAVEKLFPAIDAVSAAFRLELGTGEVNRLFEQAIAAHPPPADRGKSWKLFYATQVSSGPPTFMLFANRPLPLAHTYRRYLENRLRETYDLAGVPVRLVIRQR
jgi:GTP-binding protein